jgi:hypothetical protein
MFCVICKDTQPFASPFVQFYAQSDFFFNPPSHKSLPKYTEGIVRQITSYSMPPSSSNKRKYDNFVIRSIDDKAIESFD